MAGEKKAQSYLRKHLFKIVEHNWRSRRGEIDIIAKKGRTIHFIEVKTRSTRAVKGFSALDAVDKEKQRKIQREAADYIRKNYSFLKAWRIKDHSFDIIAVEYSGLNLFGLPEYTVKYYPASF